MIRKLFLFTILFLTIDPVFAQRNVYPQSLYWLRYQIQINFSKKIHWTSEVDNRRFFKPDIQNQLIFHSRLHFNKDRWNFAGGLTLSNAYTQLPQNGYRKPVSEIRPVAEITHELKGKKVTFLNRLRIDNRFFEENEKISIWNKSRHVTRIRYRLQLQIPLYKNEDKNAGNFRIANEIMINTKENVFDQNRFYVTGDFSISKNFSLETGYIYIYQQRSATNDFFSRHVLRFSVLHRVSISKN